MKGRVPKSEEEEYQGEHDLHSLWNGHDSHLLVKTEMVSDLWPYLVMRFMKSILACAVSDDFKDIKLKTYC